MEDRIRREKERALWERQASTYDDNNMPIYKHAYDLSIRKVRSILSPEDRVLEIGCGTGIISLGIAPDAQSVMATDISPRMIKFAKIKAEDLSVSNVEFMVHDGYSLPFDDESFDVVLLFNTLHIVKEPEALLREAHRLLKPGGQLATATDCYGEPVPLPVRLMLAVQKVMKLAGMIPFMRFYRKQDVLGLFEDCSFVVEDTEVAHPIPMNYYVRGGKAAS